MHSDLAMGGHRGGRKKREQAVVTREQKPKRSPPPWQPFLSGPPPPADKLDFVSFYFCPACSAPRCSACASDGFETAELASRVAACGVTAWAGPVRRPFSWPLSLCPVAANIAVGACRVARRRNKGKRAVRNMQPFALGSECSDHPAAMGSAAEVSAPQPLTNVARQQQNDRPGRESAKIAQSGKREGAGNSPLPPNSALPPPPPPPGSLLDQADKSKKRAGGESARQARDRSAKSVFAMQDRRPQIVRRRTAAGRVVHNTMGRGNGNPSTVERACV